MKALTSTIIMKSLIISFLFLLSTSLFALGGNPPPCTPGWKRDQYVASPNLTGGDIQYYIWSIVDWTYPYPYTEPIPNVYSFMTSLGITVTNGSDNDTLQHIYQDTNCNEYVQSSQLVTDNVITYFPYNSPTTITAPGNYTIYAKWDDQPLYADDSSVTKSFILQMWTISKIRVVRLSDDSAQITWYTEVPTTSKVKYGLTRAYDHIQPEDTNRVNSHSQVITGLTLESTFHYSITSKDAWDHTLTVEDFTFILDSQGTLLIFYLDDDTVSNNLGIRGYGSIDTPWHNYSVAMAECHDTLTSTDQVELRLCQGTYEQQLWYDPSCHLIRLKGGYPPFKMVSGITDKDAAEKWITNHRNPRRYKTLIQQSGTDVVHINGATNLLIDGFTIRYSGGSGSGGIYAPDVSAVTVSNNIIRGLSNQGYGIAQSGNITVLNNLIVGFGQGIRVNDSSAKVLNNTFYLNSTDAIWLSGNSEIRNNILVQNGDGIYSPNGSSPTGGYNCFWNNLNGNYIGLPPELEGYDMAKDIYENPRLSHNGNQLSDGYYLAQVGGDVSLFQARTNALAATNGISLAHIYYDFPIIRVYSQEYSETNYTLLGQHFVGSYTQVSTHLGNILLEINGLSNISTGTGDYITIKFRDNNDSLKAVLPKINLTSGNPMFFWVGMDGSTFYARSDHGVGLPDLDAPTAMSDKTTHLAYSSQRVFGKSPCLDVGDPNITQINNEIKTGGTSSVFNRDTGTLDIGFHYDWPFVSIASNAKYFEKGDGTPIIPIGPRFWAQIISFQNYDNPGLLLRQYLQVLKDHGTNIISPEIDSPYIGYEQSFSIEFPVGVYDQGSCNGVSNSTSAHWIDKFFDLLDEYDIYLMSSGYDNYRDGWSKGQSMIESVNGGPVNVTPSISTTTTYNNDSTPIITISTTYGHLIEYFSNTTTRTYHKQRFDYWTNRWGWRSHIISADIQGEIDNNDGSTDTSSWIQTVSNWLTEMVPYVRNAQTNRWKYDRLMTAASLESHPPHDFFYKAPYLDFVTNHFYGYSQTQVADLGITNFGQRTFVGGPGSTSPNAIAGATTMNVAVKYSLSQNSTRIFIASEHDPAFWDLGYYPRADTTITSIPVDIDNECEHNLMWAHAASGGLGSGQRFPLAVFKFDAFQRVTYQINNTTYRSDDPSYPLNHNEYNPYSDSMLNSQLALSKVLGMIDWPNFNFTNAESRITCMVPVLGQPTSNVQVMACGDTHQMLVWILDTSYLDLNSSSTTIVPGIKFSGFTDENHDVIWLDDSTGEILKHKSYTGSSFTVPPTDGPTVAQYLQKHFAILIKPATIWPL